MIFIKYAIIFFVFCICVFLGNTLSKKYVLRVNELKEVKNALNIIESKIKFTYEPIPEVFDQTSKMIGKNISEIFKLAGNKMKNMNAEEALNESLKNVQTNLLKEDIESIKTFGKMLGKTDKEGQISQLELTKTFIEMQIEKAKNEEEKNSKLYKTLGTIIGLAVVIILV